eukprot:NODE_3585_length_427_cov_52.044974_g3151_i0.p1 GENE.NODE_3585_length_427_cov_52.044974_g3151_i0~~NODE_3585_length_427_cov_52.044974_g3151_i0.p1  ORF type:complete len:92 (-),score=26.21 NODE_3585_length_427_cov_52.044974_g3151_i0:150-404(-)
MGVPVGSAVSVRLPSYGAERRSVSVARVDGGDVIFQGGSPAAQVFEDVLGVAWVGPEHPNDPTGAAVAVTVGSGIHRLRLSTTS